MKKLFIADAHQADYPLFQEHFSEEYELNFFDGADACFKTVRNIRNSEEEMPDVIIIDLRLPDFSGMELFNKLSPSLEDTQFILMVPKEEDHVLPDLIKAGIMNYVIKEGNFMGRVRSAVPKAQQLSLV